ncbi:MAG: Na-Ca exchanger/integrin-beta4, partial [Thermoleophilia bacterium]|nr:Na-Ca exchanger/integrin-beta4 [Thermoleophilia bacterium]
TDTPLSGAARGPAIAYDRSVVGATATTLYGIDTNSANLIRIGGVDGVPSADGGQVLQVGTTGVGLNASVSMAISPSTGIAYMSNPVSGGTTAIHTLNLTTGAGTAAGVVDGTLLDMVLLPPSTVQVAAASTRAAETAGAASITVSRTGDLRLPASVQYSTADGTARGASDFVATSGSLEFPAGVTSRVVQVPLIPDAIAETAETFTLTVSGATGGASLGGTTTTVTIDDAVVPVVPVVPPAVDRTAPKVLVLALAPRSAKVIGRAGVRATFSCSEGCTASARLLLGRTALGAVARTRLTAAGIGALRVTTTKLGQRRLTAALATARTHRARLTYELTVADASGNRRTVRLPLVAIG